MPNPLTPAAAQARHRDIIKRYERGESMPAIGRIWGLSRQRIKRILAQSVDRAGRDGRPRKKDAERWPSGGIKY